jgi:hypothetical protein
MINPEAELSLLSLGTGGDFRKTFEMEAGLEPSLHHIAEGRTRRIDVGCLTFVSPEGKSGKRYFANIASFGLSGEVVDRVNNAKMLKRYTGGLSYTWSSLSAILRFKPRPVRLKVDNVFDDVVTISTCAVVALSALTLTSMDSPGATLILSVYPVRAILAIVSPIAQFALRSLTRRRKTAW